MGNDYLDLDDSAVDPDVEKNGVLMWYGGIDGEGVAFIVRYHLSNKFQMGIQEELKRMSFALRTDTEESLKIREQCRCRAMARYLLAGWGPSVIYAGKAVGGKELRAGGKVIEWIAGSDGSSTAKSSWNELSEVLANPKYRRLREQILIWAADEDNFNNDNVAISEEDAAKN